MEAIYHYKRLSPGSKSILDAMGSRIPARKRGEYWPADFDQIGNVRRTRWHCGNPFLVEGVIQTALVGRIWPKGVKSGYNLYGTPMEWSLPHHRVVHDHQG